MKLIDSDELPEELRADFISLCATLESVRPLPGESAVQATVRKMSADEADRCAGRVVSLALAFAREGANHVARPGREARNASDTVVPLFAAEA